MVLDLLFYILFFIVAVNCGYYLYFSKVNTSKIKPATQGNTPVSIIVCAKNEAENLRELVPLLITQDYPHFEIILVNDASTDDTMVVINEFVSQYRHVKAVDVINNETFWGNKKYALTLGIKTAVNDHLLFIDADCRPASPKWLTGMSGPVHDQTTIVLGYGGYEKVPKSLLNALIRYETALTAMQYLGYALRGNPYMGVGRNLAYTAKQFYDVNGFMSHMRIMGGDDDLFVNEAATAHNTAVALDPESFTISKPKETWSSWWIQKKRHVNTAKRYKKKHKMALGGFFLSQFLFLILAVLGFVFGTYWETILALVILRYVMVMVVMGGGLSRFRESELTPLIPLLEWILIFCQMGLFFSNTSREPKRWK